MGVQTTVGVGGHLAGRPVHLSPAPAVTAVYVQSICILSYVPVGGKGSVGHIWVRWVGGRWGALAGCCIINLNAVALRKKMHSACMSNVWEDGAKSLAEPKEDKPRSLVGCSSLYMKTLEPMYIQDMYVKVEHCLAAVASVVDHKAVAVLQAVLLRNLACREEHMAQ